jgi:hypothetical protein
MSAGGGKEDAGNVSGPFVLELLWYWSIKTETIFPEKIF